MLSMFPYRLDESPNLELLSVGDKVLEVNGVTVKEQSLDEVNFSRSNIWLIIA